MITELTAEPNSTYACMHKVSAKLLQVYVTVT